MKVEVPQSQEWRLQRQQRWDDVWEDGLRVNGISKQEQKQEDLLVSAKKCWYLEGDLTPMLSLYEQNNILFAPRFIEVLQLCPIGEVDAYLQFIKDFSVWLSERQIGYWKPSLHEMRDERFYAACFGFYKGNNEDSTEEIYRYMLAYFIPNDGGDFEFPFAIGTDGWQPSLNVNLANVSFDILTKLSRYLFSAEDEYKGFSHLKYFVHAVKHLNQVNSQYFDTKFIKKRAKGMPSARTPRNPTKAGQSLMRKAIGSLLGYRPHMEEYEEPLRHNDLEVETELRELIDSLDMPEEYACLVDFIHANPDDFVAKSEERE